MHIYQRETQYWLGQTTLNTKLCLKGSEKKTHKIPGDTFRYTLIITLFSNSILGGTRWLGHFATIQVAGSIPDGVIGIFH